MGRLSRVKWCLTGCLIGVLALAGASALQPNRIINAVNFIANTDVAGEARALTEREATGEDTLVEMVVESVEISKIDSQPIVILRKPTYQFF